jgi:hypothetical protein
MPDPKKPSTVDEIVSLLRGLITEPVTDQSSRPPNAGDVKRVKASANPPKRRKAVKKKTATKKKVVTKKKKKPARK